MARPKSVSPEEKKRRRKAYALRPDRHPIRLEIQRRYREKHRERLNAKERERRKRNREHFRILRIKYKYGLTPEEYKKMHAKQEGKCAICFSELLPGIENVDHDHATGEVRGLLCGGCNSLLGFLEAKSEHISQAMKYLTEKSNIEFNVSEYCGCN